MAGFYTNQPCRTVGYRSTNTSNNAAYTAAQPAFLVNIRVTNILGAAATITLGWYDSAAAFEFKLISSMSVPANSYVNFPFEAFRLKEDDEIRIQSGTNNAFDSVITVVEVPGASR